jgi:uncharacterized membrane protein (DUF485 family)
MQVPGPSLVHRTGAARFRPRRESGPRELGGAHDEREDTMVTGDHQRVLSNPKFQELVRTRSGFAWALAAVMLAIYLGFILLVAFAPALMATKIGDGVTSLGIVLGLVVIVSAFLLTGIYVQRANSRFDDLTRDLTREIV